MTDGAHFGDPVGGSTLSTLCMYDDSAAAQPILSADTLPGGDCQGKPCWRQTASAGFKFKDRDSNADGVATIQLKSGPPGENNIKIKGQKENLNPPNLPLTLPVTMQLLVDTGSDTVCFQVNYDQVNRNDGKQFKARAP